MYIKAVKIWYTVRIMNTATFIAYTKYYDKQMHNIYNLILSKNTLTCFDASEFHLQGVLCYTKVFSIKLS